MKLERHNKYAYRIVDGAGSVVACALVLSNGRWAPYDSQDRRIGKVTFATPSGVLEWLTTNRAALASDGKRGGE